MQGDAHRERENFGVQTVHARIKSTKVDLKHDQHAPHMTEAMSILEEVGATAESLQCKLEQEDISQEQCNSAFRTGTWRNGKKCYQGS